MPHSTSQAFGTLNIIIFVALSLVDSAFHLWYLVTVCQLEQTIIPIWILVSLHGACYVSNNIKFWTAIPRVFNNNCINAMFQILLIIFIFASSPLTPLLHTILIYFCGKRRNSYYYRLRGSSSVGSNANNVCNVSNVHNGGNGVNNSEEDEIAYNKDGLIFESEYYTCKEWCDDMEFYFSPFLSYTWTESLLYLIYQVFIIMITRQMDSPILLTSLILSFTNILSKSVVYFGNNNIGGKGGLNFFTFIFNYLCIVTDIISVFIFAFVIYWYSNKNIDDLTNELNPWGNGNIEDELSTYPLVKYWLYKAFLTTGALLIWLLIGYVAYVIDWIITQIIRIFAKLGICQCVNVRTNTCIQRLIASDNINSNNNTTANTNNNRNNNTEILCFLLKLIGIGFVSGVVIPLLSVISFMILEFCALSIFCVLIETKLRYWRFTRYKDNDTLTEEENQQNRYYKYRMWISILNWLKESESFDMKDIIYCYFTKNKKKNKNSKNKECGEKNENDNSNDNENENEMKIGERLLRLIAINKTLLYHGWGANDRKLVKYINASIKASNFFTRKVAKDEKKDIDLNMSFENLRNCHKIEENEINMFKKSKKRGNKKKNSKQMGVMLLDVFLKKEIIKNWKKFKLQKAYYDQILNLQQESLLMENIDLQLVLDRQKIQRAETRHNENDDTNHNSNFNNQSYYDNNDYPPTKYDLILTGSKLFWCFALYYFWLPIYFISRILNLFCVPWLYMTVDFSKTGNVYYSDKFGYAVDFQQFLMSLYCILAILTLLFSVFVIYEQSWMYHILPNDVFGESMVFSQQFDKEEIKKLKIFERINECYFHLKYTPQLKKILYLHFGSDVAELILTFCYTNYSVNNKNKVKYCDTEHECELIEHSHNNEKQINHNHGNMSLLTHDTIIMDDFHTSGNYSPNEEDMSDDDNVVATKRKDGMFLLSLG